MAKVTGKFQITLPKALVDRHGIRVGDELELRPLGRSIQIDRRPTPNTALLRRERWLTSTERQRDSEPASARGHSFRRDRGVGRARNCTSVAALVDTNILVYRFDPRFPDKQARATELLRTGIAEDSLRVPHQALIEFIAATTKPLARAGPSMLSPEDARREMEEMLVEFDVLYPDEELVRVAIRGAATYGVSWFDAHV